MDHSKALHRLVEGNQRFVNDKLEKKLQDAQRRASLTQAQTPFAIILSCADSRVVPELIFDTGMGELFVIRVAGNISNRSSIASIEYAVAHCGAKLVVVLGHESCGAVTAAMAGGDNGENINHLVSHIMPSIDQLDSGASLEETIRENAMFHSKELITQSNIISDAVNQGSVKVVPGFYSLTKGTVDFLE